MEHYFYLKEFKCPGCGTPLQFKDFNFSVVGMTPVPFCPNLDCDTEFAAKIELVYAVLGIEAQDLDLERFVHAQPKAG